VTGLVRCPGLACGTLVDPARGMCRHCARALERPLRRHAYMPPPNPTVHPAPSDPDSTLHPSRKNPR
jgi:hypothetical protein